MKLTKPHFWDYTKPNIISILLLPLTIPIFLKNFFTLVNTKKFKKIKTICVGNIYLGGTGKTPSVIKISQILNDLKFNVIIGKKFYSSQFDEKILIEKKTKLISAKNRKEIVELAIQNKHNCLVFDDGLQDKNIFYDLEIVCFNAVNWIGNGNLIPSGPLREKISSLKKYDAVFLKHQGQNTDNISNEIKKIKSNIDIFRTSFEITNLGDFDLSKNYLVVSGIGNPEDFKKTLINNKFNIIDEISFPDHYDFKKKDIENIKERAKKINANIITTEKDYVKISKIDNKDIKFIQVDLKIENELKLINFFKLKLNA